MFYVVCGRYEYSICGFYFCSGLYTVRVNININMNIIRIIRFRDFKL